MGKKLRGLLGRRERAGGTAAAAGPPRGTSKSGGGAMASRVGRRRADSGPDHDGDKPRSGLLVKAFIVWVLFTLGGWVTIPAEWLPLFSHAVGFGFYLLIITRRARWLGALFLGAATFAALLYLVVPREMVVAVSHSAGYTLFGSLVLVMLLRALWKKRDTVEAQTIINQVRSVRARIKDRLIADAPPLSGFIPRANAQKCVVCGKRGTLLCVCRDVAYCCAEHQTLEWPNHRAQCEWYRRKHEGGGGGGDHSDGTSDGSSEGAGEHAGGTPPNSSSSSECTPRLVLVDEVPAGHVVAELHDAVRLQRELEAVRARSEQERAHRQRVERKLRAEVVHVGQLEAEVAALEQRGADERRRLGLLADELAAVRAKLAQRPGRADKDRAQLAREKELRRSAEAARIKADATAKAARDAAEQLTHTLRRVEGDVRVAREQQRAAQAGRARAETQLAEALAERQRAEGEAERTRTESLRRVRSAENEARRVVDELARMQASHKRASEQHRRRVAELEGAVGELEARVQRDTLVAALCAECAEGSEGGAAAERALRASDVDTLHALVRVHEHVAHRLRRAADERRHEEFQRMRAEKRRTELSLHSKEEERRQLEEKVESLTDSMTCRVCEDRRCNLVLTCGHKFCGVCIAKWEGKGHGGVESKNRQCPVCRQEYTTRVRLYDV